MFASTLMMKFAMRCIFSTVLFKSFLPASILYNLTPARGFGKSVEEKRSNRTENKLAEAVENCDVFMCEFLTLINNGMLPLPCEWCLRCPNT